MGAPAPDYFRSVVQALEKLDHVGALRRVREAERVRGVRAAGRVEKVVQRRHGVVVQEDRLAGEIHEQRQRRAAPRASPRMLALTTIILSSNVLPDHRRVDSAATYRGGPRPERARLALTGRDGRAVLRFAWLSELLGVALSMATLLVANEARAEDALTVEEAIREARASNAQLPVAAADVAIARERVRESRARRWLQVSVEAGARYAPAPLSYGSDVNGENAQVVANQPLYAGGAIDARVRVNEEELLGRAARYRVDEKDVELDVRVRFAQCAQIQASLAVRQSGLDRLASYLTYLGQLKAAGQPVTADLLKTRARQLSEIASARQLARQLLDTQLLLSDLLGRPPEQRLSLAPLPAPQAPETTATATATATARPWLVTPDVREATNNVRAAAANIDVLRAERKPHVSAVFDAGLAGSGFPGAPPWTRPADRLRNDAGVSAGVSLSWVVFDLGIISSRVAQAEIARDQSAQLLVVANRHARLEWARARTSLRGSYDELEARARTVPVAHDAYLETESLYRGGVGSALEVLDAYTNWVSSSDAHEATLLDYRIAQAQLERWGTK
jgi:outer membrane protein